VKRETILFAALLTAVALSGTATPAVAGPLKESTAVAQQDKIDECKGILHQKQYGLEFGGDPGEEEGVCVINKSEEQKVLEVCSSGHYCQVEGVVEYCKDSGDCVEIKNIKSVNSAEQTDRSWTLFDHFSGYPQISTYIDTSAKQDISLGKVSVTVLTDYSELSSATMFGLSEKHLVLFDCLKGRYSSGHDEWYDGNMGAGRTTKIFPASKKWSPIPEEYIKLFEALCSP
jgi:hypothetical protein